MKHSLLKTYFTYLAILSAGVLIGVVLQCNFTPNIPGGPVDKNYWDVEVMKKYMTDQPDSLLENKTESNYTRLSCWISTSPKSRQRAVAVISTWAKRCNQFAAMSTGKEKTISGIVALNVTEGYENLWAKTRAAFTYMYERYHNQTEWYFKADDDTYAIIENLKGILKNYDSNKSYYFGCRFKGDFMSGGAGYVLSKEALRRLVEQGFKGKVCKEGNTGSEDVLVGECLHKLGTTIIDSIDTKQRLRFLPFPPEDLIIPGRLVDSKAWFYKLAYYPIKLGLYECCSDYPVTFHYISPERMFAIEYFLYSVKIYAND